jgi:hypothetical protein
MLGLLSRNSTMKTTCQSNNTCKRYDFLKKCPMNFKMKFEIKYLVISLSGNKVENI